MQVDRGEYPDHPPLTLELAVMDCGFDPGRIREWEIDWTGGPNGGPAAKVRLAPDPQTVSIEIVKAGDGV